MFPFGSVVIRLHLLTSKKQEMPLPLLEVLRMFFLVPGAGDIESSMAL